MQSFEVTDVERMSAILETFSILDDIRWSEMSNYNSINYYRDDLTEDEKLLTHWLCYITDRQMPFKRVWDIGGYVISHIVHTYTTNHDESIAEVMGHYVIRNGNTIRLESPLESSNATLDRYGITGVDCAFASRYMPEDLVLIYHTLGVLNKAAGRSIARFMCLAIDDEMNLEQGIKRLASALNQLTYAAGGTVLGAEFDRRIKEIDCEIANFELEIDTSVSLFGRKRLWCSIRDYLKSPEFNPIFVAALEKAGCPNSDRWKRDSAESRAALKVLELPGDVWNNAEIFREGLFRPYVSNDRKTWDMPRTIREIYKFIAQSRPTCFYPEQLDVSFDFVPQMCQQSMCDVCLFGAGIEDVCRQSQNLLCSVVLYSCGYKYRCDPLTCGLKKNSVKGFCKSSCVCP